jgi:hypothetical protein
MQCIVTMIKITKSYKQNPTKVKVGQNRMVKRDSESNILELGDQVLPATD